MRINHQVVLFDAAELASKSSFWAGVLGGTVDVDDGWHMVMVDGRARGLRLAGTESNRRAGLVRPSDRCAIDPSDRVIAQGALFGGHALYVKDNRLHYVNNFVGMMEQKVDGTEDLPVGENLLLSASFTKDGEDPPQVSTGILSLYHRDTKVGEGRIKTQPGMFSLAGEGLCIGHDSGAPVTGDYAGNHGARFTGGTIKRVAVDVSGDPYVDLEREAQAMLARE